MKKTLAIMTALAVATPVNANTWNGETADGVRIATIGTDLNEISVICDAGINAPITSINFMVGGDVPSPTSTIALFFDKKKPMFLTTDEEGSIASYSKDQAADFEEVLANIKASNKVKVRIFNGETHSFALRGSSAAIGDCSADFTRYELALN